MLQNLLGQFGFSVNEVKLYLLLAEVGKGTAQLLAKRAGLPRTTAYSVLAGLVSTGMISEEKRQGSTFFVPGKPEALLRLVAREREEIKRKETLAKELIEEIKPCFKSKFFSIPRIQFFEGGQNVDNMLYDYVDEWRSGIMAADFVWWGYQDHTFVERYRPWLEYYWRQKTEREKVQLLSNRAPVEQQLAGKVPGRVIKPVPASFDFSSTIWICGDYIVLLMTRNEPHYAFQMRDAVFASNLRLIFQLLWGLI